MLVMLKSKSKDVNPGMEEARSPGVGRLRLLPQVFRVSGVPTKAKGARNWMSWSRAEWVRGKIGEMREKTARRHHLRAHLFFRKFPVP